MNRTKWVRMIICSIMTCFLWVLPAVAGSISVLNESEYHIILRIHSQGDIKVEPKKFIGLYGDEKIILSPQASGWVVLKCNSNWQPIEKIGSGTFEPVSSLSKKALTIAVLKAGIAFGNVN